MIETIRKHGLVLTLLWCTVLCGGLIALRMVITDQHTYRWLIVPNVLLAWIPLVFAGWTYRLFERSGRWNAGSVLVGLVWLFFFPNCFYIITDLVHIGHFSKPGRPALLYYDVSINVMAAILGWLLGVLSLYGLHRLMIQAYGSIRGHGFAVLVLLLGSIGVYLGRFLRWNSWDLIRQPLKIVQDSFEALTNWDSMQFIAVFALVTGSLYFVMYNWKQSPNAS